MNLWNEWEEQNWNGFNIKNESWLINHLKWCKINKFPEDNFAFRLLRASRFSMFEFFSLTNLFRFPSGMGVRCHGVNIITHNNILIIFASLFRNKLRFFFSFRCSHLISLFQSFPKCCLQISVCKLSNSVLFIKVFLFVSEYFANVM